MRYRSRLLLLAALVVLVPGCSGKKDAKNAVDVDPSPVTVSAVDSGATGKGSSHPWEQAEEDGALAHVFFDFDRAELKPEARTELAQNAEYLKKHPELRILVEGHCDEFGTNEYNLTLGELRAQNTKKYLVSLGIPAERIETVSYGKEKPLCPGRGQACWAQNRRAHFLITARGA
jgi:peptidoglycan-associated lipoprotein